MGCNLTNMKMILLVLSAIAFTLSTATLPVRAENACSGVDRTLPKERAKALGPVIAKQLDAKRADISQSFRFDGWSILYVSTGEADDAFVFYSGDPMRNKYVARFIAEKSAAKSMGYEKIEEICSFPINNQYKSIYAH